VNTTNASNEYAPRKPCAERGRRAAATFGLKARWVTANKTQSNATTKAADMH
jgi:hypothetical protein